MTTKAFGLIAIVLVASAAPAAFAAEADSSASANSSVSFETEGSAIVDYGVGGETVAESIRVQSQDRVASDLSLDVGANLGAVTGLTGAGLSVAAESGVRTTIQADSGATLSVHDDGQGSLVVASDGEAQYVEVGLPASASAEADGDGRVLVTTENGTTGAFLATGDGSVTVNDDGNVSAAVEGDGRLVFHAYPDGRDEADRQTEDLITSGQAAASVYVTGDGSDAVTYDGDTTVEVTQRAQGQVDVTVDRASHEGRVIVTNVAEGTFESAEDVQVSVDGEAAARAESMAQLRQAADGGDNSRYVVRQRASASASTQVLVGVNHFSTREVSMSDGSSGDGTTASDGESGESNAETDGESTAASGPGFTALGALVALLAAVALVARRR